MGEQAEGQASRRTALQALAARAVAEQPERRALRKAALKALAAGLLVTVLLVGTCMVLASTPVRTSPFGLSMETRFPVTWSGIALVFGSETQRIQAVDILACSRHRRALPLLSYAAHDASRRVRAEAVGAFGAFGSRSLLGWQGDLNLWGKAEERLIALCGSRRADVRACAYATLEAGVGPDVDIYVPAPAMAPAVEQWQRSLFESADPWLVQTLTRGLADPDPRCRREAARTAVVLVDATPQVDRSLLLAFRQCVLGPSPGAARLTPLRGLRSAPDVVATSVAAAESGLASGDTAAQMQALLDLWVLDTPEARLRIRAHLKTHTLAPQPEPGSDWWMRQLDPDR